MPNEIAVEDLRPGDLLLHVGRGEISKLIQWASDSDYSHVAMVFAPGLLAEAVSGGVGYDHPLAARVASVPQQFERIDIVRPVLDPIAANVLDGLQASAKRFAGARFALNQMFELGVISALRNRMPSDPAVQRLLTWIFDQLLPDDPSSLVCSEFVYRSYERCGQPELDPTIPAVASRAQRSFPRVDWIALWKEYREAKHRQEPPASLEAMGMPGGAQALDVGTRHRIEQDYLAAQARARSLLVQNEPSGWTPLGGINPKLVLPQDLAASSTFKQEGRAVP